MSRTLSLPTTFDSGEVSDSGSLLDFGLPPTKFPHTRAQLASIARQHRSDGYDTDAEGDDLGRVDSSFVTRVVSLLDQEREDELKALLQQTYDADEETVSFTLFHYPAILT